jgi:hypothetical protein
VRPAGKLPVTIDHVYGVVPPEAARVAEYAALVDPSSSDDVVTTTGVPIVIESDRVAVLPRLSVTSTVKVDVPAVVGVPEIVSPLSVRPAGKLPVTIDHVYGVVPPEAARLAEYAALVVPSSSDDVVTART